MPTIDTYETNPVTIDGRRVQLVGLISTKGELINSTRNAVDVSIQSPVSPLVIVKASNLIGETTLTAATAIDDTVISVTSVTDMAVGQQLTLYNVVLNRVSFATILAINTLDLTLDSPLDVAYTVADTVVSFGSTDMAVNGSETPVIFGIRNPTGEDVEFIVDLTRMIVTMQLSTAGDYDQFGNITRLTNGLLCRFTDGTNYNVFNVKDNREFDGLMYDYKFIDASGNAPNGISGRFTFEKLGSVVRLAPFEDLQFIVQDDLSALDEFSISVQGAGVTV